MAVPRMMLGILLLALSGPAYSATDWETFTSKYSGCSIEYPTSIFTPNRQNDADGGTSFTSELPEASLVVAGGSNGKNAPIAEIVRSYLELVEGETITYRRQEQGWAVYSGYRGGLIYYLKVVLSGDHRQACVFELRYLPENKVHLDVAVSRMSRTLKLPKSGRAVR